MWHAKKVRAKVKACNEYSIKVQAKEQRAKNEHSLAWNCERRTKVGFLGHDAARG